MPCHLVHQTGIDIGLTPTVIAADGTHTRIAVTRGYLQGTVHGLDIMQTFIPALSTSLIAEQFGQGG